MLNINFAGARKEPATAPVKVTGKADRKEIVLKLAEKQSGITRKEVEAELNVSQATAILLLREMVEKGMLIKDGSGRHQKYRISE